MKNITVFIDNNCYTNTNYWLKLLNAIVTETKRINVKLYITVFEDNDYDNLFEDEKRLSSDGFLFIGNTPETYAYLRNLDKPYVLLDCLFPDKNSNRVYADNFKSGYEIGKLLINNNHKNLAFVGNAFGNYSYECRYFGFKKAFEENKNKVRNLYLIAPLDSSMIDINYEKLLEAMNLEQRPTAIFSACDMDAEKVYTFLNQLNFKIPDDVSIIGFDNMSICERLDPPLTSVHVSRIDLALSALNLLLEKIDSGNSHGTQEIKLVTKIVHRKSIRKLLIT